MSFDSDRSQPAVQLPAREAEILALAAKGYTDKQISQELGISRDTVGTYWRRILLRFRASSRTEVVARVMKREMESAVRNAHEETAKLIDQINRQSEAQANAHIQKQVLAAVQQALVQFVSGRQALSGIFRGLLNELLVVTESEFGFVAETRTMEDGTVRVKTCALSDISWDEGSRRFYERATEGGFEFGHMENLLGAAVRDGLPVISNNALRDNRSKGVPKGHPAIKSFLSLPVLAGGKRVGILGIANRAGGYSEELVTFLEPLIHACAAIITGIHEDEERQKVEQERKEKLEDLNALLDSMDSAVILIDGDKRVRFVNAAFCDYFLPGWKPEQAVGRHRNDLMKQSLFLFNDPQSIEARVDEIVGQEDHVRDEEVHTKDGRTFLRNFHKVRSGDEHIGNLWTFREHV